MTAFHHAAPLPSPQAQPGLPALIGMTAMATLAALALASPASASLRAAHDTCLH